MAKSGNEIMLNHDVGVGKTASAVNIMRWYYAINHQKLATLVIAPIVTRDNWLQTVLEWSKLKREDVLLLRGSGNDKAAQVKALMGRPVIIVTNLESILNENLFSALLLYRPQVCVLDESHQCKSYQSKRAKQLAKIFMNARYRILLSGTPILNQVTDIFMQFKLLDGGATFGNNYFLFRAKYMYDANAAFKARTNHYFPDWRPRLDMFDELSEKISRKCHRAIKSECLDLPPYRVLDVYVEMSATQKKHYMEMKRDFITYVESSREERAVLAQLAITKSLRLQQIVSGFLKTDDGHEVDIAGNPRLAELENLLGQITIGHKVIVWALFKRNHVHIAKLCSDMGLEYVQLNGDQSADEKAEAVRRFQTDASVRVMIANQQAGGTGVNLQAASYSIYYSRSFNLAHDLQSEARCYRGGSEIHEKITRINLICPDTIDQVISEALSRKEDISKKILDAEILSKL
jgi:SNF2 family DNA or RNA helicase